MANFLFFLIGILFFGLNLYLWQKIVKNLLSKADVHKKNKSSLFIFFFSKLLIWFLVLFLIYLLSSKIHLLLFFVGGAFAGLIVYTGVEYFRHVNVSRETS